MSADGDLHIASGIIVPAWELQESFVRASGPGGQNVNKVSTAVQLRWNAAASSLPPEIKARFLKRYQSRLTREGDIIIDAKTHRRQVLNREEARERLADMIKAVAAPPKRRIKTRPTKGSVVRRLSAKKQRGEIKSLRGKIEDKD